MKIRNTFLIAALLSTVAVSGHAEPFIYPQQGQSAEQQQADGMECEQWARSQTGYAPGAQVAQAAPPPPTMQRSGRVVRGAARGAVLGEVISDDAGKGAAAGALIGGMRQRDDYRRQQENYYQQQQQIEAQQQALKNNYDRAFGTCMQARGYSIG
jgi:hypothetical protein